VTPDVVVDVGNSRIKCGWCAGGRVFETAVVAKDPREWQTSWKMPPGDSWLLSGVDRSVISAFGVWLRASGRQVTVIESHQQIPIRVNVPTPERVGHDRLFGAVAALRRFPGRRLFVVDCGTAVTVNLVTADGTFHGGAILPGLGLMARSLHWNTAQLPLIELTGERRFACSDTAEAIRTGVFAAVVGAVDRFVADAKPDHVVYTGGDGGLISERSTARSHAYIAELTLEGVFITAESLP
jgi:type III pantothenate kinase